MGMYLHRLNGTHTKHSLALSFSLPAQLPQAMPFNSLQQFLLVLFSLFLSNIVFLMFFFKKILGKYLPTFWSDVFIYGLCSLTAWV